MTRLLRNSEDELRFHSHASILSTSIDTETFFEGTVCNISCNLLDCMLSFVHINIVSSLNIKTFLCRRPDRIDLRHLSEKDFKLEPLMVRCSVLLVTTNNIIYLSGSQLQYNSIGKKGYIVNEFVQFIDIPDIFGEILTSFDRRLEIRKSADIEGEEDDKQGNHLTVLSTSPGSGKSTAMMHFPLSEAYKSCHRRRTLLSITRNPCA